MAVEGPQAFGIYDLNLGRFYRVNVNAGKLLQELNGLRPMQHFSEEENRFLNKAKELSLVECQRAPTRHDPTPLQAVLRKYKPVRFAWIEITSKCNQKCLHCFLGDDLNAYAHKPIEKIQRYISVLVEAGTQEIVISGGEPTLHPKIREVLEYATQFPIRVSLLSAASTRRITDLAECLARNYVNVKIPLLGWEKTHDTMTGLAGGFEKTIQNILFLKKGGVPLELGTTVTAINWQDIPKIRAFANEHQLSLKVSPVYRLGFARKNEAELLSIGMQKIISVCKEDKPAAANQAPYKPQPTRPLPKPLQEDYAAVDLKGYLTTQHECGQKIIAILSNDLVTPCLLLRDSKFSIGSTQEHDLAQILASDFKGRESFDDLMSLQHIPGCNKCEARFVCKAGGCPATSVAMNGTVHTKNPLYGKCYYVNSKTRQEAGLSPLG